MSMQAFSDVFGDRIISSGIWPACSPVPKRCAFFFCGCLKDNVYNSNLGMQEELKENIRREIANIPAEQLQGVNHNLFRRCEECLRVERQHLQHLLRSVNKAKNVPSFRTLTSAKFVCASQQAAHRPP
jgi:hypothetical protein